MGFFKKLWNVHDKVFHPIETSLKKKGGSNNISGLLKGAGITPKDAPETIPGSSFQMRPGYNAQTHMFEPTGPLQGTPIGNANTGGRTYTPNPFAQQQAQVNAIRGPGAAPPQQMVGMAQQPMGAFQMGPQQPPQDPNYRPMMF